jgi:DNA-binding transcriptional LysR family regulator
MKLESIKSRLTETTDHPTGILRVTTTVGLGTGWLTERAKEFLDLYPEINLQLVLTNEELDLTMRQADCAVRLRQPQQPDLIQRRLFTVHLHVFASQSYLDRHGTPKTAADLDQHRIVTFGEPVPTYLAGLNALETVGRPEGDKRQSVLQINDLMSIMRAVRRGVGIAMLPDYMAGKDSGLVPILSELDGPSFDTFFVYPDAMKNQAKLKAFRDFMFAKARNWTY